MLKSLRNLGQERKMARISNSNLVRFGYTRMWFNESNSVLPVYYLNFTNYFLQRFFLLENPLLGYGLGSVSYAQRAECGVIYINLFDMRPDHAERPVDLVISLLIERMLLRVFAFQLAFLPIRFILLTHSVSSFDSRAVMNYFKLRLAQRVPVMDIVAVLIRLLSGMEGLLGFRIDISGRYGRQQRAAKFSVKKGVIMLSRLSASVDYSEDFVILKHGKCGIKIWLNKSKGFLSSSNYL